MDLAGLVRELEAAQVRAAAAAVPAANAMARTYEDHLVNVTLVESGSHPPVTQTPAAPGRPPAVMTGRLRGSVTRTGAIGGGGFAMATVAPHTIYAATQEWGGDHHGNPLMWLWVRYIGPAEVKRRGWRKEVVHIPARPYMRTAVAESSGAMADSAGAAFYEAVWGGQ